MNGCLFSFNFRAFQHGVFLQQCWGSIVPLKLWLKAEILRKSWFFIYLLGLFYIDVFPSRHRTGIICFSSCTYRRSLSQRGYKLSSSREVFIYKQKKLFQTKVTASSLHGYLWALFLRKGGRWMSGFTDTYGENIKTKVLVCKFALLVRDAGIPE